MSVINHRFRASPSIPFGKRRIGADHPVVIIAEIGVNHEGDPAICARMIEEAARAGVDAVKLQIVRASENYVPSTASYEVFSRAELPEQDLAGLFAHAQGLGLEIFATCGDFPTMDYVESLNPAAWKISSGLLTHLPLIRRAAGTGRTLLMSTGMADDALVDGAVDAARQAGSRHIGLFQCTSLYPAPPESLNLAAIRVLEDRYGVPVGLSDHSSGLLAAVVAVGAGAKMIEKHFSLDPLRPGFDHGISLDPEGLARLVEEIRTAQAMLGTGAKELRPMEQDNALRFHRVLVTRSPVSSGTTLTLEHVGVMRTEPGKAGLPPSELDRILGRIAVRNMARYECIQWDDVK